MVTSTIPASAIVNVQPNVTDAGGTGLDLVGLILTTSTRTPIGAVVSFASALDVAAYFGPLSAEYGLAVVYFDGYNGSTIKPAALRFWQYPTAAVGAYLRGGTPLSLAALTALSGTLTMTIGGRSVTSSTISLGAATSMSDVAALVQAGLADYSFSGTAQQSTTTLTVTAVTYGTLQPGMLIAATGAAPNTRIVSQLTGTTGGIGTYTVSTSISMASQATTAGPTTVTYDSVSGAFVVSNATTGATSTVTVAGGSLAAALALTTAAGAVTSQGAAIATPVAAMDAVVAQTQDFVSFTTTFEPSTNDCMSFAAWTDGRADRFVYAAWDSDATAYSNPDTSSLGYLVRQAGYDGTMLVYDPANGLKRAVMAMGAIASFDFNQPNGRTTLAFRVSGDIIPGVTSQTTAAALIANGYNFYGSYATANDQFNFFYPGQISGEFKWVDSYVNQIQLNDAFQLSLMTLLVGSGSVPFTADGEALVEAALQDPINGALSYGSIRAGVTLSNSQAASVNASAGRIISDTIQNRGWYVLVRTASAGVRAARGPLSVSVWYCDGQSVQQINLASNAIQ